MNEPPVDPLAALSALYLKGLTGFQAEPGTSGASASDTLSGAFKPAMMSPAINAALTDCWRISAASAIRYGQALMGVQMRYQAAMLRTMSDATGRTETEASALVELARADDARAFLREIGEAAEHEARRLQLELAQAGEALATATAATQPSGPPARRTHRVKR